MAALLTRYILALLLTLAIEGAIAYLLGFRQRKVQLALAVINLATNLLLNYSLFVLGSLGVSVNLALIIPIEIGIVLAEWGMLVYTFIEPKQRFLWNSILGNAASFGAGLLLYWT